MATNEIRIPATLESARTYRTKDGLWKMELVYTYEAKDGTHRFTIPACELPVSQSLIAIDVKNLRYYDEFSTNDFHFDAYVVQRDDARLHKGYAVNVIWQDQLIKPRVEEMTIEKNYIPEIKNVIFNDPATIVFWEDGTKTIVKCQDGDEFDPEKGLAMAIAKKAYGNKGGYCNKLKKWLPKEEQVDTNNILDSIFVPKEFTFTADIDKLSKSFMKGIRDGIDSIFKGTRCTSNDNSVSSKKCMTFREEAAKLRPERIDSIFKGGVCGCPRDIDTCPYLIGVGHCPSENDCRACWDREIPDELLDND